MNEGQHKPQWVRNHFEIIDEAQKLRDHERFLQDVEDKIPGTAYQFSNLIERIPSQEGHRLAEFPVVAAVLLPILKEDGTSSLEVVASGLNIVNHTGDGSNHAEMAVMREAAKKLGRKSLEDCCLFTTVEPCPMCADATNNFDIGKVVFGAYQDDLRDKYILVDGEYKRFRAAYKGYSAQELIERQNLERDIPNEALTVIGGYMRDAVIAKMGRTTVTVSERYSDPDSD